MRGRHPGSLECSGLRKGPLGAVHVMGVFQSMGKGETYYGLPMKETSSKWRNCNCEDKREKEACARPGRSSRWQVWRGQTPGCAMPGTH